MKSLLSLCWAAAAAIALCTACSEDTEFSNDTLAAPQPLVFVATQNDVLTSESRAAAADTWDGDGTELVAIQIGDDVKKYKVTDTDGTLEPSDDSNTFYRTNKDDITVTAWYPYSETLPDVSNIISIDQSTTAKQESSNLMKATATAEYGKSTTLAFSHQAARIHLYLKKEGSTDPLTEATVTVTVTNAGSSTPTEYTAHEDGKGYYSVLVAPGAAVDSGADFISITVSGVGTYKATAPAAVTSFVAGKSYEYDFNLKRTPYVTFTADAEQGFKMTLPSNASGYSMTFEYSVGGGAWTKVTSGEEVTFGGDNGDLRLRGQSSFGTASSSTNYSTISFTKDVPVAASGDIRTLVDYKTYSTASTGNAGFAYLFKDCTVLTSAPELPATRLTNTYCYYGMFYGCTALTSAPALPATSLAANCYNQMFLGCTSLTKAPVLDAETLAWSCYSGMFKGCTSLTKAPALDATTLASYCYREMFSGCTSLTTAPTLSAKTMQPSCYSGMFSGCTGLTSAPTTLSAETLAEKCCYQMFYNCKALTTAPELNATTLAESCYYQMFYNCKALTQAPNLPAETMQSSCYSGMFYGCTSLTKAPELKAETLAEKCYYQMFSGCTKLASAPTIKATTLAENCCEGMFKDCTSLTSAPNLPATTLAPYCYVDMFSGCTGLTSAPALNATKLAQSCYNSMFYGCTSLKTAPELANAEHAADCYRSMFSGCSKLSSVTIKLENVDATTSYGGAFGYWLSGVASTGTINKKSSLKLLTNSPHGIPQGWTVKDI